MSIQILKKTKRKIKKAIFCGRMIQLNFTLLVKRETEEKGNLFVFKTRFRIMKFK